MNPLSRPFPTIHWPLALALVLALLAAPLGAQEPPEPDPFDRGVELYRNRDLSAALIAFREAEEQKPNDPLVQAWLGFVLLRLDRPDHAITHLDRALEAGHRSADLYNNRGNARLANGEVAAAIADYLQATELAPASPDAWFNLGNAYVRQDELEKALEAYQRAARHAPRDAMVLNNLGYVHDRMGDTDKAIEFYREATQEQPTQGSYWRNLGLAYRKTERWEQATAALAQAVQHDKSGDYTTQVALGESFSMLSRLEEAAAAFRAAVEIEPREYLPHYNLGLIYSRLEEHARAMEAIEQAAGLPGGVSIQVLNAAGWVHFRAGQLDKAGGYYQQAAREGDPENEEERLALAAAYANLGVVRVQQARTTLAIEALQEALQLNVADHESRALLASLYLESQQFEAATEEYRLLLTARPEDANAANNLGFALEKQGKMEEAVAAYQKATELNPEFYLAFNNLGAAYERLGRKELAEQNYRKALEINPDFQDARANLERIIGRGAPGF